MKLSIIKLNRAAEAKNKFKNQLEQAHLRMDMKR